MKQIIIQGSARSNGNTHKIVTYLQEILNCDVVDLNTKNINYYDYNYNNSDDDFIPFFKTIVEEYDVIIFATPVYWYTMSAQMKTFFDRISDCLRVEKEIGRKLRGKSMAALCCSSGENEIPHFFTPFILSAEYLGMNYHGDIHTWIENEAIPTIVKNKIIDFSNSIK